MTRRARRPDLALLLCLPLAACGMLPCGSSCGDDGALAELTETAPGVERDLAVKVAQWSQSSVGDRFHMGDGLRTPAGKVALLDLKPSGGMRVEPETVVRFQSTPGAQGPRLGVESGEIVLDTGEMAVGVDTGSGVARVSTGTRVRVGATEGGVNLRVMVGQLELDGEDGPVTLGAGEELTVRVGDLELEPPAPVAEAAAVAVPVDAGTAPRDAPLDPAATGAAPAQEVAEGAAGSNPFEDPPARVDLELAPAGRAIVHDPSPPTALAIPIGCAGEATVDIGRGSRYRLGSTRGTGRVHLSVGTGAYNYRVRCDDGAQKVGRVVIRRDPGTRRLPRTPPRVTVDADGRPYTVRYQNLLPELTFTWPRAPKASAYELRVTHRGKQKVHKGSGPRIALPSGKVRDGTHRFSFSGAGTRSKEGVLKVAFDNTAGAAYVSSPADGVAVGGGMVKVSGAALAGSKVSIGGAPVATTREGRFTTQVAANAKWASLAIRVQHAASGVHYYLRHLAVR